jgi:hypothetical protein
LPRSARRRGSLDIQRLGVRPPSLGVRRLAMIIAAKNKGGIVVSVVRVELQDTATPREEFRKTH